MSIVLWITLSVIGYVSIGLLSARMVFEYYCRFHVPSYHRMMPDSRGHNRSDVHTEMGLAFVVWPLFALYFIATGTFKLTMAVLTSHPPKPVSKTERLTILEEKNKELETKTGIVHRGGQGWYERYDNDVTTYKPPLQSDVPPPPPPSPFAKRYYR